VFKFFNGHRFHCIPTGTLKALSFDCRYANNESIFHHFCVLRLLSNTLKCLGNSSSTRKPEMICDQCLRPLPKTERSEIGGILPVLGRPTHPHTHTPTHPHTHTPTQPRIHKPTHPHTHTPHPHTLTVTHPPTHPHTHTPAYPIP
jgi:hypothetical protein